MISAMIKKIPLPTGVTVGFSVPIRLRVKLRILKLTRINKKIVRKISYEEPTLAINHAIPTRIAVINLSDLNGINRQEGLADWIEAVGSLHKQTNFDIIEQTGLSSFENYILNNIIDLPQVIESNGAFYINGGGKHRLTIAKCCHVSQANVVISVAL
ncbi:hypothetical protein [Photobacterium phosphoreum]|uniref:hypothetical protein n=1 Tax=Photobacterium phosphoreum TaxID=659 RepID=UPI000D1854A5|nr:hypothetical protein [Photobacterium phosphoreum]PSU38897.1 hypothetical protein CTM85_08040 [Photobacterium phosphoreum]